MLAVLLSASLAATPVCSDRPTVDLQLGRPPDAWPTYPGRCLDQGPAGETLLQRARRCVREEPEDPAPIRLLGHLGDARDVPVLEALTMQGLHTNAAIDALAQLDPKAARPALVRIACFAPRGLWAVRHLSEDPRPEELPLYAMALEQVREAPAALGRLGTDEARGALRPPRDLHRPSHGDFVIAGLIHDRSDQGMALLRARRDDGDFAEILGKLPADHPWFRPWAEEARNHRDASVRRALVRRASTLDDAFAIDVLEEALDDADESVRHSAAVQVGKAPGRFASLVEAATATPPLALAYHRGGLRVGRPESLDAIRSLQHAPATRWDATEVLLYSRQVSEAEQQQLSGQILEDPQAPEALVRRLQQRASRPAQEPLDVDFATIGTPTFSRERSPVRGAGRLARKARGALDDDDESNDPWARAVLPWVGDDTDLPRLVHDDTSPAQLWPLADLGTEAALDVLEARGADEDLWGWTRTQRGWDELLARATSQEDFESVVRPEAFAIMEAVEASQSDRLRSRTAPPDRSTWSPRQRREAIVGGLAQRDDPWAILADLTHADGRQLHSLVRHHGYRLLLVDALDGLPDDVATRVLDALVGARWHHQPPPSVVLEAARERSTVGAWALRIQAGDHQAVVDAWSVQDRRGGSFALMATVARLHDHDPPATLVASLNDWIQSGDVPVSALQQLAQLEAFQPVLREAVLSGTIPVDTPCEVLPQAEALGMDDAWIVDAMLSCTRDARVRFEDRERPARLQELLLQRELTPRQLTYALSLHRSGPEIVRPFLDSEDPEVRSAVLGHLRKAGIPDGEIDRIAAWAAAEAYDGWNGSAMDVLIQHAPERALGILAPRLADADNWNAARMVAKIPSDAAMEALLPVLRRGTERKVEQVAKWVRAHGGPVYEANRGLVDGYLTPTWEKHP